MSHLSCMAMTYTHHCLRWCGFKGSPVCIPIQLTPQVWLTDLLPPDGADFTVLACQCAVVGKSGGMLLSIWGLSDSVSPVLTVWLCVSGQTVNCLLYGNHDKILNCFMFCKHNSRLIAMLLEEVKRYGCSNHSDKYSQQECNLHYSEKEDIFLRTATSMCFCFHPPVCSCIPFLCVVRDGEIAGEWLTKTWPSSEVITGGRLE